MFTSFYPRWQALTTETVLSAVSVSVHPKPYTSSWVWCVCWTGVHPEPAAEGLPDWWQWYSPVWLHTHHHAASRPHPVGAPHWERGRGRQLPAPAFPPRCPKTHPCHHALMRVQKHLRCGWRFILCPEGENLMTITVSNHCVNVTGLKIALSWKQDSDVIGGQLVVCALIMYI